MVIGVHRYKQCGHVIEDFHDTVCPECTRMKNAQQRLQEFMKELMMPKEEALRIIENHEDYAHIGKNHDGDTYARIDGTYTMKELTALYILAMHEELSTPATTRNEIKQ